MYHIQAGYTCTVWQNHIISKPVTPNLTENDLRKFAGKHLLPLMAEQMLPFIARIMYKLLKFYGNNINSDSKHRCHTIAYTSYTLFTSLLQTASKPFLVISQPAYMHVFI